MTRLPIKKMLVVLAAVLLTTGLLVSQAGASEVCLDGDCVFTFDRTWQNSTVTPSGTWGTMAFTDTGDDIWVDIDLAANYRIDALYLNYADGATAGTSFSLPTIGSGTLQPDGPAADGYPGLFDMRLGGLDSNGPYGDLFSGTLSATGFSLDPEDFFLKDSIDGVYAAMRIVDVNLFAGPGVLGGGSAWILASTAVCPVPEPSTLLLLGGGLAGLAGMGWRRRKSS